MGKTILLKSKKNLIIIGGKAGADIAQNLAKDSYFKIYFYECFSKKISESSVINLFDFEKLIKLDTYEYFIATGDNYIRHENYLNVQKITDKKPVNLIHPSALIESNVWDQLGFGNLILANSYININSSIGNLNIINTGSIVEHDCQISNFVQLSPNVSLGGNVSILDYSFIGIGASVLPNIKITQDVLVGAHSVVLKDIDCSGKYVGVPARKIDENK